jgi:hypothetical protein
MKIIKTALVFTLISFLSSCATHTGYMTNSASLSSDNFNYVNREVSGTAMATYVFFIGGLSKIALVDAAKNDLLVAHPLENNQTLVNLTVNWKYTFVIPFLWTNRCTVTGDIVEFKQKYPSKTN